MDNLNFLTMNNFYTNPFSTSYGFNTALSDSTCFNQADFISTVFSPSSPINMPFLGSPFTGLNFNFPFMNTFTGLSSAAPAVKSNSNVSQTKNFSKKSFTQRENQLINEVAQRINCDPNDLKAVMYSESGCNPAAVNSSSGATGLIQFMPSTAKRLGTTTQQLKNMSIEQQLPYVEKYLSTTKKDAKIPQSQKLDAGTLYSLIFLPAFANREILCSAGSKYYNANKGLDKNKDGQITKTDLANRLQSYA